MSNLVYRIPQEFIRIEALNTRGANQQDAADPIWLNVRTTFRDDVNSEVESVLAGQSEQVWKVQTGLWLFQLTPGKYEAGKAYTAHFRFEMTPGNLNVARKNFVWQPIPDQPHDPDKCIVYGTLMDVAGVPVAEQKLIIEQYSNYITLNHRIAQNTVYSDSFGLWQLELPKNAIVRVVFGDLARVIKVPDLARAPLNEIIDYQPESEQRDKYGYPLFSAMLPVEGIIDRPQQEPLVPVASSTDAETLQGHPAADFALAEHEHTKADITDLEPISATAAAGTIPLAGEDGAIAVEFIPDLSLIYSVVDHNHDLLYSAIGHNHDLIYAPISHGHSKSEISDLETISETAAAGVVPKAGQDGKISADFLPIVGDTYVEQTNPGDTHTLPASPTSGTIILVKNNASGSTTVSGGLINIESSTTLTLLAGEAVRLRYNGTAWLIVGLGDKFGLTEQWVPAPATASSAGIKGQLAADGSYLYICVATNTWIRATVSGSF